MAISVESRVCKLKMPILEGEDLYSWIFCVERYFLVNQLNEEEKLATATICL